MHLKSSIGVQGTSGEFKAMFATFSVTLSPAEFYNILIDAGSHAQLHRLISQGLLNFPSKL